MLLSVSVRCAMRHTVGGLRILPPYPKPSGPPADKPHPAGDHNRATPIDLWSHPASSHHRNSGSHFQDSRMYQALRRNPGPADLIDPAEVLGPKGTLNLPAGKHRGATRMSEFSKSPNVVRDALVDVQDARLRQQANEAEIKQLLGPELYEDWQDLRQQT